MPPPLIPPELAVSVTFPPATPFIDVMLEALIVPNEIDCAFIFTEPSVGEGSAVTFPLELTDPTSEMLPLRAFINTEPPETQPDELELMLPLVEVSVTLVAD